MYAAPPVIETVVFATLPDSLRIAGRASTWVESRKKSVASNAPVESVHSFLEGPSFDREGNLYCVDIPYSRIFRISPAGVFGVAAEYDGQPNGLKIHKDGRIFIADRRHGIMILDARTGEVKPHVQEAGGERFRGINDRTAKAACRAQIGDWRRLSGALARRGA